MLPVESDIPALSPAEEFAALVHKLRLDFRRLFPHLRPREDQCFFVQQNPDQSSGKVWIEYLKNRDGRTIRSIITIAIEENRAVRRVQQEMELEEELENTALVEEQFSPLMT